jgi:hypothetical protein
VAVEEEIAPFRHPHEIGLDLSPFVSRAPRYFSIALSFP